MIVLGFAVVIIHFSKDYCNKSVRRLAVKAAELKDKSITSVHCHWDDLVSPQLQE